MAGVSVTVSGPQRTYCKVNASEVGSSISFIYNVAYTNDGVLVWRAYGVGSARPSAKKTHRSSRGFSKRETVTMQPVKKDVHQVLPAFLFLRKTSGL
ncbi:hypothetical protein pdam_00006060 [Pocillopora damicornis]|uniref:Uncharacterized protein n=1 Tax=Pocillopora damicornis TaxID=46731 RepID=A0A3M6TTH5_POCDA|nr:hypothetical protein pdam_00006060 [Pocillopora damicornis]